MIWPLEMKRRSPSAEQFLCPHGSLEEKQAAAPASKVEEPAGGPDFSLSRVSVHFWMYFVTGVKYLVPILSFLHCGDCIVIANYTLQLLMDFHLIVL